ncbi:MAG: c-type cytochrome [Bacteroidia bacterium]|nr:c-type cytochrome [Bacteroidia bacterium]
MKYLIVTLFLITVTLFACKKTEEKQVQTDAIVYDATPYILDYSGFNTPLLPTDNALTIQGVKLGRMLFYENMLSRTNTQSCGTCHQQQFAFSDTAKLSTGVRGLFGLRNSMSAVNMAWNNNGFFWDGRANLLRDQALMPIQDHLEMDENLDTLVNKLSQNVTYKNQFIRAFGTNEITAPKIALALEQFMHTIVSNNSKYDKYKRGELMLDSAEERGRKLFFTEYNEFFPLQSGADCAHCHSGVNFSNNAYMNNGLKTDAEMDDIGRQKVTFREVDKGKFKVPTLRNIALTPPYMSDGSIYTLEEVVEHYNSGLKTSSTLDPGLAATKGTGLRLTAQNKLDLVAFLKTLTDYSLINNPALSNPQ